MMDDWAGERTEVYFSSTGMKMVKSIAEFREAKVGNYY